MLNKILSNINKTFMINFFKKRAILISCVIFLLVISGSYIIYLNTSHGKTSTDKTNYANQSNTQYNTDNQKHFASNNKIKNQAMRSFDNINLVNDNIGVPVLYYHSVQEYADNEVTITPKTLKEQLTYLKDQGYIALTMNQLEDHLLHNSPIPEKSIVITFDDGYMDNYYNAFPILKDLNMAATIFCITSNLDGSYYLSKEAIHEMSDYGIDIESHTINHAHLDKLTYSNQLKELEESKKTLESITGKEVNAVAYPFGDFNDDSIEAAKNAGYKLGFTTNRGLADRSDFPLKLDRIYISSKYNMHTFKEVLLGTKK